MKQGYESVKMRVTLYGEDVVRTSEPVPTGAVANDFSADNGESAFEEGGFACGW